MSSGLVALLLAVLACGVAGLGVPALIRAVPEPSVDEALPDDPQLDDPPPDEPLPDEPLPDEPLPDGEAGEPADDDDVKEPYADIAALPGLSWKAGLASAITGGAVAASVGATWHLLVLLPLVPIGVALALIDWRTHLLPKRIIAPTYALVVASVLIGWAVTGDTGDLTRAGWGWLVSGGLFLVLWFVHPRGLGYGDVRLSGVLGIALGHVGWGELFVGVYAGFLIGGVGGLLLRRLSEKRRKEYPFGPFMLSGVLVGLFLGPVLASRYGA